MMKDKFSIVTDDDGIVVYDKSDDFDPEEMQVLDEDDELDTEYLLRETACQEAKQAAEHRRQRRVSVGVIVAVAAFIAGVFYINFRNIL